MWLKNMADQSSNKTIPDRVGGKVEVKPRLMKEMLKPIMFGNSQKKFQLFTYITCSGT